VKKAKMLIVLAMGVFCSSLFADQIVLKNGDRLSGAIIKSDAKNLVIKTDYAGEVTVDWSAVQDMNSTKSLHVGLKSGQTVVGPLAVKEGKLEVTTKDFGILKTPADSIVVIRDDADQLAYEKSLHPGFSQGWAGGANLGFALTAGNSETKNLNIGFNATRTGSHDKLMLYETSIYATTSKLALQPIPSQTTANSNNGGIRYDHDFTPRVFGFGAADLFNNALQDLDLRYILGGGIGLHAIKTPNTTLDLLAGINYTHESFSGLVQTNPAPPPATITYNHSDGSPALTVGDNFTHKLGKNIVFTQSFFLYPSFGQTNIAFPGATPDNVHIMRGAFNLGLVTKLHKWLGWQVTLADVFDNHPLASTPLLERNDITLATGLNISFTH
jgi:putative salt-induced outer membrane protein YdiY